MKLSHLLLTIACTAFCANSMHAAVVSATIGPTPGIKPLDCASPIRPNPVSIDINQSFFTTGGVINSVKLNGGVDSAPCYVKQLVVTFDSGQQVTLQDGSIFTPPAPAPISVNNGRNLTPVAAPRPTPAPASPSNPACSNPDAMNLCSDGVTCAYGACQNGCLASDGSCPGAVDYVSTGVTTQAIGGTACTLCPDTNCPTPPNTTCSDGQTCAYGDNCCDGSCPAVDGSCPAC